MPPHPFCSVHYIMMQTKWVFNVWNLLFGFTWRIFQFGSQEHCVDTYLNLLLYTLMVTWMTLNMFVFVCQMWSFTTKIIYLDNKPGSVLVKYGKRVSWSPVRKDVCKSPWYTGGDYVFVPVGTPPPQLAADPCSHAITFEHLFGLP